MYFIANPVVPDDLAQVVNSEGPSKSGPRKINRFKAALA